ncbi:hypothetical protein QMW88_22490 [Cronobacter dublinensis]|uniref:hypothetical protein n=2 Tax=Cronobacter dublinensis TaxID=413497 RepID=UPI0037E261D2|nr:hypothetical protein [Cronobacter dublinensis]
MILLWLLIVKVPRYFFLFISPAVMPSILLLTLSKRYESVAAPIVDGKEPVIGGFIITGNLPFGISLKPFRHGLMYLLSTFSKPA